VESSNATAVITGSELAGQNNGHLLLLKVKVVHPRTGHEGPEGNK